jgi:hypothetical protein
MAIKGVKKSDDTDSISDGVFTEDLKTNSEGEDEFNDLMFSADHDAMPGQYSEEESEESDESEEDQELEQEVHSLPLRRESFTPSFKADKADAAAKSLEILDKEHIASLPDKTTPKPSRNKVIN